MVSSSLPETTRGGMEMKEGGHAETEWNLRAAVGNRRDAFLHASSPDQIVDEIANLRDDLPVIRASYCTCSSFAAIEILNPKPIPSIYPGRQETCVISTPCCASATSTTRWNSTGMRWD